jgi:hypothetical protein
LKVFWLKGSLETQNLLGFQFFKCIVFKRQDSSLTLFGFLCSQSLFATISEFGSFATFSPTLKLFCFTIAFFEAHYIP